MNIDEISQLHFWQQLSPELSISSAIGDQSPAYKLADSKQEDLQEKLREEGYFQTQSLLTGTELDNIRSAIEEMAIRNIPAVFGFIYDEAWNHFLNLRNIIEPILGDDIYIDLSMFWAWKVDPGETGFPPHRDTLSEHETPAKNLPAGVENRYPEKLTLWTPLTDVTENDSCIHVLPTNKDPNYPNDLESMEYQGNAAVRAIPTKAGSLIAWNAYLLHWGSAAKESATSRIAIATDFSKKPSRRPKDERADFGLPLQIRLNQVSELSFEARLNAIAMSIWTFRNRLKDQYPKLQEQLYEFCFQRAKNQTTKALISEALKYTQKKNTILALVAAENFIDAVPLLRRLYKANPNGAWARQLLCKSLIAIGKREEADVILKKFMLINRSI